MSTIHTPPGLSPTWLRHQRECVLRYASAVALKKTDPNEVLQHTASLTAWVEKATSAADRQDRVTALEVAFDNWTSQWPAPEPPGSADGLLHTARHYYEYLAA